MNGEVRLRDALECGIIRGLKYSTVYYSVVLQCVLQCHKVHCVLQCGTTL